MEVKNIKCTVTRFLFHYLAASSTPKMKPTNADIDNHINNYQRDPGIWIIVLAISAIKSQISRLNIKIKFLTYHLFHATGTQNLENVDPRVWLVHLKECQCLLKED